MEGQQVGGIGQGACSGVIGSKEDVKCIACYFFISELISTLVRLFSIKHHLKDVFELQKLQYTEDGINGVAIYAPHILEICTISNLINCVIVASKFCRLR